MCQERAVVLYIYIYIPPTHTHTHVQLWLLEGSHVGVGLCQLFPVGRLSTYFVFSMHALTLLLLLLFFLTIKVPHPSSPPPPLFHLNIFLILAPESTFPVISCQSAVNPVYFSTKTLTIDFKNNIHDEKWLIRLATSPWK